MAFSSDGRVEDGIECGYEMNDGSLSSETVYDVIAWVKARFLELLETARRSGTESKTNIFIDAGKYRFAELSATDSKFTARFYHPAYVQNRRFMTYPAVSESDDVDKISADVVEKASKIKFR